MEKQELDANEPGTYTVRVSGTASVWADIKIKAKTAEDALDKVSNNEVEIEIAHQADWQLCEGGNGVDDWTPTGDVYDHNGNCLMEDFDLIEEEG